MILKRIYGLLTQEERKRGIWVAFSVLLRALLDFAGIAALIPVLLSVFGVGFILFPEFDLSFFLTSDSI